MDFDESLSGPLCVRRIDTITMDKKEQKSGKERIMLRAT